MALKIDQQSEDALTFRIASGIGETNDLFLGFNLSDFSWAEAVEASLPETLAERLTKICGESGLAEFLYGQISRRVDADPGKEPYDVERFTEIQSLTDPIQGAKGLVEELRKLPYAYRITAPLPASFSREFFELCQNMEIGTGLFIKSGSNLLDDFPLKSEFTGRDQRISFLNLSDDPQDIESDCLYFVQNRSGYIGNQKDPPVISDFKNSLRQFLGAALAVNGFIKAPWPDKKIRAEYVAHQKDGETEIARIESFAPSLLDFYAEMSGKRSQKTAPNASNIQQRKIDAIRSVFSLNDHGRRLSVAAIWYLRSHMSGENLDALLESTIALEALLGGANNEGTKLSSLLGNRCAYLIAKSVAERQDILSNFNEIYTLRSKIVHEGHHRFTAKERTLLAYSRDLCRRCLVKEMEISPDRKK